MKKVFAILLLTAALLTSCSTSQPRDAFLDTYLLTDMQLEVNSAHQTGVVTVPAKLNVISGTLTPLCEDPLCTHTVHSDCPFLGFQSDDSMSCYLDGKFYYIAKPADAGAISDGSLLSYDISTTEVKLVCDLDSLTDIAAETGGDTGGYSYIFADGYYYREYANGYSARIDLKTGRLEELSDDFVRPVTHYGDDRYLFAVEKTPGLWEGFYIADEDGSNPEYHLTDKKISIAFYDDLENGNLVYATVYQDEDGKYHWQDMTLWIYNFETGEDRILIEHFPSVRIVMVGEYLYCRLTVDDPPLIGYNENSDKDVFNHSGGVLWRIDIHTGERGKVCEFPEHQLDGDVYAVGSHVVVPYKDTHYDDYTVYDDGWYDYKVTAGYIVYDTAAGTANDYPTEYVDDSAGMQVVIEK